jgi:phage gp16-like protein
MRPATKSARPAQPRPSALAQIHIAKKALGLDDDTYRAMLFAVARVHSARDLDHAGREAVLAHMKRSGWKPAAPKTKAAPGTPRAGEPHNLHSAARGPQLQKIEAQLASAGRPWAYAHNIARRMFGLANVALANEAQLQKIIAALAYDAKRRATQEPTE